MKNNFPKIPLFLSAIFFILSCFVFLFFYRIINSNDMESQLKERVWQTEEARRNEIKALDNSVKMIEGEKTQLETHFAQSSDVVPFLDTIEGLALVAGSKAEVTSVNILEDNSGLLVGMKDSGSFGSLYKFLTLLENSPYELEFVSMDLSKETGTDLGNKKTVVPKWDLILKIKLLSFVP